MAEWTDAKDTLASIQERHFSESGKIIQKLLALTLLRLGYDHIEERAIQGVDIDVGNMETGERHSFEVKTSKNTSVPIGDKDVDGLKSREADGYETFFAVLCLPIAFSEGWIIAPAAGLKSGRHKAMALLRRRDDALSGRINELFPDVVEEAGNAVLGCEPGTALRFLRERYDI